MELQCYANVPFIKNIMGRILRISILWEKAQHNTVIRAKKKDGEEKFQPEIF